VAVLIQTADVPERERADFWRTSISESFVPMDTSLASLGGFTGSIRGGVVGPLQAYNVTAGAHVARRTPRQTASSTGEYFKISVPLRGYGLVRQDDREASLAPGDLAVYDTNRPYEIVFADSCELLVMMFPQESLRIPRAALANLTAQRVSGRHGIGALVAPLLSGLVDHIDEVGAAQSQRLADSVLDLLTTVFLDRLGNELIPTRGTAATLLLQAKAFIDAHLNELDLTPDVVAAAVHISTGYLHKLFRGEGTSVSRHIRDRRLENCRRDLTDPFQADVPVSTVGARWGFVDAARFSRVFKIAYGASPREYRHHRD